MDILYFILAMIGSYFLGSIPFAYIGGKLFAGINIMEHGSGNVGATNTVRVLGFKIGIPVFVCDAAKGFFAAWLGALTMGALGASLCGTIAIIGHTFSPFIHFKGGKGVATAAGVILCLDPRVFIIGIALWVVIGFLTDYVSVASICACLSCIVTSLFFCELSEQILICVMAFYIVYKHKTNLKRLYNGTEAKVDWFHPWRRHHTAKR